MAKDRVTNNIKGILPVKLDESKFNTPTRPPLPHQSPSGGRSPQSAFHPHKEVMEKNPPRSSRIPGRLTEVSERVARIHSLLGEWIEEAPPEAKESFSTALCGFGRKTPGAHLQGKKKLRMLIVEPRRFYKDAIKEAIKKVVPDLFSRNNAQRLRYCDLL